MRAIYSIITIGCLALASTAGFARTWTSADGKSTFEGELISAEGAMVTVKRGGRSLTFEVAKLSSDDQAFIKEEVARRAAAGRLSGAAIPKAFAEKLYKLEGQRLAKAPLKEVVPEFYFLAYTASW